MKESLNISLQQKMQQRLSPMQVRYGRLLEMNGPEFEDEIQRVLDDNPALDVDDTIADTSAEEFKETAEDIQLADYRDDDIPSYRLEAPGHSDSERTYEPLAATKLHFFLGVFFHFITGADTASMYRAYSVSIPDRPSS